MYGQGQFETLKIIFDELEADKTPWPAQTKHVVGLYRVHTDIFRPERDDQRPNRICGRIVKFKLASLCTSWHGSQSQQ